MMTEIVVDIEDVTTVQVDTTGIDLHYDAGSGMQGPPGPPGTPGSAPQQYVHLQPTPATVWPITHGLGRLVVTADAWNDDFTIQYEGFAIQPLTPTTCRLAHDDPVSGVALIQ
jgi:hypothetical protein